MDESGPYLVSPVSEGHKPAGNNRFQAFHPLSVVPWTADLIGSAKLWRQPCRVLWQRIHCQSSLGRQLPRTAIQRITRPAAVTAGISLAVNDRRTLISIRLRRRSTSTTADVRCPTKPLERYDGMAAAHTEAAVLWQTTPCQTAVDEKCTLLNGPRSLDDRWCAFSHSANEFR